MLKKILGFVLIVLGLITTGCSKIKGEATLLREPIKLQNNTNYSNDDYNVFLNKLSLFGADFSEKYYNYYEIDNNLAISPISLYMALSLATECANNDTRSEILNVMGITYEEVNKYTSILLSKLVKESYVNTGEDKKKLISKLDLTNSIWIQDDLIVKDECINKLADNYYCYPYKADFYNNNEKANRAIREFICDKTNGLIDKDFDLSKKCLLALINTLYLKDVWDVYDDLQLTKNKYEFVNNDNSKKNLNLLQGYYVAGQVYNEKKFSHFYTRTNRGYKLKFIVPNDGYCINDIFTKDNLNNINTITDYRYKDDVKKEEYYTRCLFPEFKASCDEDLVDLFKDKYNMNKFFDPNECDFTNITDLNFTSNRIVEGIYCSSIIHKTELEVNKKGIEGAAVTIVAMNESTSCPIEEYKKIYKDFVIDKAFGYIITDLNDVMLFSGVVNNV